MKTKIKVTKRQTGYTALVTYPWGAKVRLIGYPTNIAARGAAVEEIEKKRGYTLDIDL